MVGLRYWSVVLALGPAWGLALLGMLWIVAGEPSYYLIRFGWPHFLIATVTSVGIGLLFRRPIAHVHGGKRVTLAALVFGVLGSASVGYLTFGVMPIVAEWIAGTISNGEMTPWWFLRSAIMLSIFSVWSFAFLSPFAMPLAVLSILALRWAANAAPSRYPNDSRSVARDAQRADDGGEAKPHPRVSRKTEP